MLGWREGPVGWSWGSEACSGIGVEVVVGIGAELGVVRIALDGRVADFEAGIRTAAVVDIGPGKVAGRAGTAVDFGIAAAAEISGYWSIGPAWPCLY